MKSLLFLLLALTSLVVSQCASDDELDYKSWKAKYRKDDDVDLKGKAKKGNETQSETKAERNFKANAARVKKHNSDKKATYKQSLNENADMSDNELTQKRTGLIPDSLDKDIKSGNSASSLYISSVNSKVTEAELKAFPASLDYTSQMTPIKNQRSCGSCWAFATTAVIERFLKTNGTNAVLSEQTLVDCCKTNAGCNGGSMLNSFNCMKSLGTTTEKNYPYKAKTQTCQSKLNASPNFKIRSASSYRTSGQEQENVLMSNLNTYGPLAVIIHTSGTGLGLYSSGIFSDPKCSNDRSKADHAVVLVGYGTENGSDYWTLRNSWGTGWGMKGYFRLARNKNNQCGVANSFTYATYA